MVFEVRNKLRKRLIDHIKKMLTSGVAASYFTPRQVIEIHDTLRDDILTIGFARRFATYKRAHLLFRNLERLDEIVNNPEHPVQFIFAGKLTLPTVRDRILSSGLWRYRKTRGLSVRFFSSRIMIWIWRRIWYRVLMSG